MDKSFNYCKRFIDGSIKSLNQTIVVDRHLKDLADDEGIGLNDLKLITTKISVLIKRHNNHVFQPRITSQIISQVLKSERENLDRVHERLQSVEALIKPIILPNIDGLTIENLKEVDLLIKELPESKYLFIKPSETAKYSDDEDLEEENDDKNRDDGVLIQDMIIEETNKSHTNQRYKLQLYKQINEGLDHNRQMLTEYDELRSRLIDMNKKLNYKFTKLQYLKQLKSNLQQLVENHQVNEINKFKILVDSINYKSNPQNRQEIIDNLRGGI